MVVVEQKHLIHSFNVTSQGQMVIEKYQIFRNATTTLIESSWDAIKDASVAEPSRHDDRRSICGVYLNG